jgi:hypothetical protein
VAGGISLPSWVFQIWGRTSGQVIGVEVGSDGLEIRRASRDDSGSVSFATELKVFFNNTLQLFLQLNQVNDRH